jgi:hypothetical protein
VEISNIFWTFSPSAFKMCATDASANAMLATIAAQLLQMSYSGCGGHGGGSEHGGHGEGSEHGGHGEGSEHGGQGEGSEHGGHGEGSEHGGHGEGSG